MTNCFVQILQYPVFNRSDRSRHLCPLPYLGEKVLRFSILSVILAVGFHCCCSVTQLCPTLCHTIDCSTPGFPVITNSWSLLKLMYIELAMPSKHLIFCRPLLLLPSIYPSIRVLSSESVLRITCPKYWSFGFSISSSNEYSALISFTFDLFDLLAVQGTFMSPL